jgi:hypothetical protein
MTESGTNSQQEKCVKCGAPTSYPIELNEKLYCSSTCVSKYRDEVGEHQFDKDSLATFEKKRDSGWIPERALMYIGMCQRCNKQMREMCKGNQFISGMNREKLRESETVAWCCHARFNLSSSLSDGTVALETARKIQAMAEELVKNPQKCEEIVGPEALRKKMAKPGGLKGVTTTIIDIAAAEMAKNPDYKLTEDKTPQVDGEIMIHYAACIECNPVFGAECEEQAVEKELNKCLDVVGKMTKKRWCDHTVHALSALLLNKNMTQEKLQKIVDSAEQGIEEKNDFGVSTRHLFIALGRAAE